MNGKYALVTGGGRGIGRAISLRLARDGFKVIVNYLSHDDTAAETVDMIRRAGGEAEALRFDVCDGAQVNAALEGWQERHPDEMISVLVNNAGIRKDNLLIWMKHDDWQNVLRTTLDGFFYVTKAVLKPMIRVHYGRIVNIASLSGLSGLPGQTNYSTAKGGLVAATKSLAQEVSRKGITINAVAPGYIKTGMTEDLDQVTVRRTIPAGRFGTPEEVAALVAFLASEDASYITGECISINGGLY
ncbi:MAG: 3-oxoacyl-ACP reductase FabG [Bacteroidales bacterium]|nr:3-oxoacyl-ACP reductase FabG [Bacteroidales bacterium]